MNTNNLTKNSNSTTNTNANMTKTKRILTNECYALSIKANLWELQQKEFYLGFYFNFMLSNSPS